MLEDVSPGSPYGDASLRPSTLVTHERQGIGRREERARVNAGSGTGLLDRKSDQERKFMDLASNHLTAKYSSNGNKLGSNEQNASKQLDTQNVEKYTNLQPW